MIVDAEVTLSCHQRVEVRGAGGVGQDSAQIRAVRADQQKVRVWCGHEHQRGPLGQIARTACFPGQTRRCRSAPGAPNNDKRAAAEPTHPVGDAADPSGTAGPAVAQQQPARTAGAADPASDTAGATDATVTDQPGIAAAPSRLTRRTRPARAAVAPQNPAGPSGLAGAGQAVSPVADQRTPQQQVRGRIDHTEDLVNDGLEG